MEFKIKDHVFCHDKGNVTEYEIGKIVSKGGRRMLMCMPVVQITNYIRDAAQGKITRIYCSMVCIPADAVRGASAPSGASRNPATNQASKEINQMAVTEGDYVKYAGAKKGSSQYYQVYGIIQRNGVKMAECRVLSNKFTDVLIPLNQCIPETNPSTITRLGLVYPVKEYLHAQGIKSMYDK